MNDHQYVTVTPERFAKFSNASSSIFITQDRLSKELERQVANKMVERGELILSPLTIITEPLAFGITREIEGLCKRLGYQILTLENKHEQGKYLGSDGGGHYSSDFYEMIYYGSITISAA